MTPLLSSASWEAFLNDHPEAHILQTGAWGELKSRFGWQAERVRAGDAGALVLLRRLPLGFTLAYVPKGPLGPWLRDLLPALDELCLRRRALLLKVEPDSAETPDLARELRAHGFKPSPHAIQPRRTLIVDLHGSEEEVLARMRQKTRYNIRLAARKGVEVHPWADLQAFGRLIQQTGARDGFGVHAPDYYRTAYDLFNPGGHCELFVAEYQGQPLAALMLFARGSRAWYFYGASTSQERNRMPTYLLQWEAMRWARRRGCREYDLWGIPDADLDVLEANFTQRRDGLWGVYRFKRGFGGRVVRSAGAWDRPYQPALYALYRAWFTRRAGGER